MQQINPNHIVLLDQNALVECLTHATDDPLTILKYIEKFKELFPRPFTSDSPFSNIEAHANAKLDAEAEAFHAEEERKAEETEVRMLMESKDRRVS